MSAAYSLRHLDHMDVVAVENLQKYLRIPSVHPNVDYTACVEFLSQYAYDLELPVRVLYLKPDKPVVIMSWQGGIPELPTILLNSHMDVVPAMEGWSHDPFGGEIEGGNIYGRGAQDMKSLGIQYLEAIRRMKARGMRCTRTIHLLFVPDEEIGGQDGMKIFSKSQAMNELNIGIAFDEGGPSEKDFFILTYGEKTLWHVTINCKGESGHGSQLFSDNLASKKVAYLISKANEYATASSQLLKDDPHLSFGEVTTVNCTMISGGVQENVVPSEMSVTFDCRIDSSKSAQEFEEMLNSWCREAGGDCDIVFKQKDPVTANSKMDDSNIFWSAFENTVQSLGITYKPSICSGVTDMRYLREIGIPAFGFTPINNTKMTLHSQDEFVGVDTFLRGIEIYVELIGNLANV